MAHIFSFLCCVFWWVPWLISFVFCVVFFGGFRGSYLCSVLCFLVDSLLLSLVFCAVLLCVVIEHNQFKTNKQRWVLVILRYLRVKRVWRYQRGNQNQSKRTIKIQNRQTISTIIQNIVCEHQSDNFRLCRGVLYTTLCDTVCQWLAAERWFSPGIPVSSTNKADRHDITEIVLKVTLNTIILTQNCQKYTTLGTV